jgi:bifunctional DNA primase/polymerase-like protein
VSSGYRTWALQYRERLWTGVLPLPHNAKTWPPGGYTGRSGAYPDDAQIEQWCRSNPRGNVALRMPGDVLGIDVDDYEYQYQAHDPETGEQLFHTDGRPLVLTGVKTGGATLAALEAELGPLPKTWRSSSRGDGPSGIRLFRVPPGLLWGDFGTHLEAIWWGHRYAVVYPSVNPDSGLQYLWIDDTADSPRWGAEPPKVTDLAELPESWTARFGRTAEQPKPARRTSAPAAPRRSPVADYRGDRRFTRAQAAAFVQPHLDTLRAAGVGEINNRLNDAAKVISHFVPAFWSPLQAQVLIMDALSATAYDGKTWQAERTIQSALDSAAGDWAAEPAAERPGAPRAAAARPERGPADEPPPPDDGMADAIEGFWGRHPVLGRIRDYAHAHDVNAWGALGVVMAYAITATEPNIQLPGKEQGGIFKPASLNTFIALVGTSGGGKSVSATVGRDFLDARFGIDTLSTFECNLGSGEGIAHIYMKPPQRRAKRKADEDSELIGLAASMDGPTQIRTRALLKALEIDNMEAVAARQGSTLGAQLRMAWDGDDLGFMYAGEDKRLPVPRHGYRLCMLLGVQPLRAESLLSQADGGLPQRFLWLPVEPDHLAEYSEDEEDPDVGPALHWQPPVYSGSRVTFGYTPAVRHAVRRNNRDLKLGKEKALDAHSMLARLKAAAALAMLLNDEPGAQMMIDEEIWDLSGVVSAVSTRTREGVQRSLVNAAREKNVKQAYAKAQETIVITETVEKDAMGKAVRWVRNKIGPEGATRRDIQQGPKSLRGHLFEALQKLLDGGEVVAEEYQAGTRKSMRYRRRE